MTEQFQALLTDLFKNQSSAEQAVTDWGNYAEQGGYQDIDFSQVDMSEAVYNVSNELNIPAETQVAMLQDAPYPTGPPSSAPAGSPQASISAAGSSSGGAAAAASGGSSASASSGGAAPSPAEYVPANVNHYLTEIYEDNSIIHEYDNSTDVLVTDNEGPVNVDTTTVVASGDGAVAAGDDIKDSAIATGDQAIATDGDNYGQQNTGDGAVQVGGDANAPIVTGDNTGVIANGPIDGNVATDGSTINDQDVTSSGGGTAQGGVGNVNTNTEVDTHGGDAVVGDGNQTVQGEGENQTNFGSGDQVAIDDSTFDTEGDANFNFGDGNLQDNDTDINVHEDNDTHFNVEDNDTSTQTSADTTILEDNDTTDQSINDSFNDESIDTQTEVEQVIDIDEDIEVHDDVMDH